MKKILELTYFHEQIIDFIKKNLYVAGPTLQQIAERFGVTRQAIEQQMSKIIELGFISRGDRNQEFMFVNKYKQKIKIPRKAVRSILENADKMNIRDI